jgi:hypothetical protein
MPDGSWSPTGWFGSGIGGASGLAGIGRPPSAGPLSSWAGGWVQVAGGGRRRMTRSWAARSGSPWTPRVGSSGPGSGRRRGGAHGRGGSGRSAGAGSEIPDRLPTAARRSHWALPGWCGRGPGRGRRPARLGVPGLGPSCAGAPCGAGCAAGREESQRWRVAAARLPMPLGRRRYRPGAKVRATAMEAIAAADPSRRRSPGEGRTVTTRPAPTRA